MNALFAPRFRLRRRIHGWLAKRLVRERHLTGEQIVEVWNLFDGCAGGTENERG